MLQMKYKRACARVKTSVPRVREMGSAVHNTHTMSESKGKGGLPANAFRFGTGTK